MSDAITTIATCTTITATADAADAIFRPHDIVVGGLRFYHDSSFFFLYLFSSASYRTSSLNGTQPKLATCSKVSAIWKCMSKSGVSLPWKSAAQKHVFRRLRNLTTRLAVYISRTKHDVHNQARVLKTTDGLLCCLEISWTLINKRLKIRPLFYLLPP